MLDYREREGQSQRHPRSLKGGHLSWGRHSDTVHSLTEDLNPLPEGASPDGGSPVLGGPTEGPPPEGGSPVDGGGTEAPLGGEPAPHGDEEPHTARGGHAHALNASNGSAHTSTASPVPTTPPPDVGSPGGALERDQSLPPAWSNASSAYPFAVAAKSDQQRAAEALDVQPFGPLPVLGTRITERNIPMLTPLTQSFTYELGEYWVMAVV